MSWRVGLFLLILLLVALFAAQNSGSVMVTFLNSQTEAPLSIVILIAFVAGMVSIGIVSAWQQFLLSRRLRHQQAHSRQLEKELQHIRQRDETDLSPSMVQRTEFKSQDS